MTIFSSARPFDIFPAIDLRGGRVVRLEEGRDEAQKAYGEDPVEQARAFEAAGAQHLHVVDLDAAFGDGDHREVIAAIVEAVAIPVQVGGGLREDGIVDAMLDSGVSRVIIGSAAVERPEWVDELVGRCGAERIVAGIDARDGEVRTRGWVEGSGQRAEEVAARMAASGVRTLIYTNIARDGMLSGPDIEASARLAKAAGVEVIVSGGVGTLDHIRDTMRSAYRGLSGIIVGKALYEERFTLKEALEATRAQA